MLLVNAEGIEMAVAESGMDELKALVNKAVGRAELKARKRENLSLQTTVEFLDGGGLKLTQIRDVVTLTHGQAVELMERIACGVMRAQVRAS